MESLWKYYFQNLNNLKHKNVNRNINPNKQFEKCNNFRKNWRGCGKFNFKS